MTPTDSPRDTSAASSDDPAVALDQLRLVRLQDAAGGLGVGVDGGRAAAERDQRAGLAVVPLERDGMGAGQRGRAQPDLAQNVVEIETGRELSG